MNESRPVCSQCHLESTRQDLASGVYRCEYHSGLRFALDERRSLRDQLAEACAGPGYPESVGSLQELHAALWILHRHAWDTLPNDSPIVQMGMLACIRHGYRASVSYAVGEGQAEPRAVDWLRHYNGEGTA